MLWGLILVVAIQPLLLYVLSKAILNGLVSFHGQLNVDELLFACRLVININAFINVLNFSFEQLLKGALHRSVLHLLVELLVQDLVELADILLLVNVVDVPAECLQQLVGSHILLLVAELEVVEDSL